MRVICPISGIPLKKSDYFLGLDLTDEHPIFRMKASLLFNKDFIHKFSFTDNKEEKLLIFLAFLNATELVTFEHVATPSIATMESNFIRLVDIGQWVTYAKQTLVRRQSFPEYIVRKDNSDLLNIKSWLVAIEDLRTNISKSEYLRDKNAELLRLEADIKREINDANVFGRSFTPNLARWALEVCDITFTDDSYKKWMRVLCTATNEAWMLDIRDLRELEELLQCNLPLMESNPQALSVMHQMRALIQEHKTGYRNFSIFSDDSEDKDFEILDEKTGTISAINQHLIDIPTTMPIRSDYPNNIAFIVAKAKYDLAQMMKAEKETEAKESKTDIGVLSV